MAYDDWKLASDPRDDEPEHSTEPEQEEEWDERKWQRDLNIYERNLFRDRDT